MEVYWDYEEVGSFFFVKGKVHFNIGMTPANETKLTEIAGAAASAI